MRVAVLTPKERECLRLVAQQLSSKEIARELGISKASVDTYCNRARAKLGVSSRRAAAQIVVEDEAGLAPPAAGRGASAPTFASAAAPSRLPPLAELGPWSRLGLILAAATVMALAFGMLMDGMQSLNTVVEHARAAPHPDS
jgi:DNA-binding CsgD family transcriptional regulator